MANATASTPISKKRPISDVPPEFPRSTGSSEGICFHQLSICPIPHAPIRFGINRSQGPHTTVTKSKIDDAAGVVAAERPDVQDWIDLITRRWLLRWFG